MKRKAGLFAVTIIIAFSPLFQNIIPNRTEGGRQPASLAKLTAVHLYHAGSPDYEDIIRLEAAWIAYTQLDSGAIPMRRNERTNSRVVPYFANISAIGLLEEHAYIPNVKKYMDWYFSHLNRSDCSSLAGTIYDYDVTPEGAELPLNKYDSVDSYASTFLSLARKYCEVTGDRQYLADHKKQIGSVCKALLEMTSPDGLTWAKPGKKIKYLMNNSESYLGYKDAEWIYGNVYSDFNSARFYEKAKHKVADGIERKLWNAGTRHYRYYISRFGFNTGFRSDVFYPDATSQLYPVWTGMLQDARAVELYDSFSRSYPGWPALDTGDRFPYALIAYTGAALGDKKRVDEFLNCVKTNFIDRAHPWPWYCMEAGVTILTAEKIRATSVSGKTGNTG